MFATAARILLSAIFLLLAVSVSPLLFSEPEPESAPVWSLRVLKTPEHVAVGDVVSVEVILLRNGLPGAISMAQPVISVIDEQGNVQDEADPVLLASGAVWGDLTRHSQRWVTTYTAMRPGPVRIHAIVTGQPSVDEPLQMDVRAEGISQPISVATPQMTQSGPPMLSSVYFGGVAALCLVAVYLYRRQAVAHNS